MDLALAIEEIRPGSRYRLNSSVPPDQEILEWMGPGDEPTQQELDDAWVIVEDRILAEQQEKEYKQANEDDARARFLLSQLANKTPQEIHALMQNKIDNWSSLSDARSDLREWLPLIAGVMAWKVIDQE